MNVQICQRGNAGFFLIQPDRGVQQAKGKIAPGAEAGGIGQGQGVFTGQGGRLEQVWPNGQGSAHSLLPSPAGNLFVVAAEQYRGHGKPFQILWPGVVGIFQQAVGKTFFLA